YHLAEPDALDARVTIGQLLALDISAPLRPRYLSARGKQAGGTEQNPLMVDQALLDGVGDRADQQFELLLGRPIAVGAQLLENEQLTQQGEGQHQPGDAVAPVEQLRQVYAGRFDGGRFAHPTHSALRQDRKSRLSRPGRRSKGTAADLLASVEDLKAAPDANYAWAIIAGHAAHSPSRWPASRCRPRVAAGRSRSPGHSRNRVPEGTPPAGRIRSPRRRPASPGYAPGR